VVAALESFIRERSWAHGTGDRLTEAARGTLKHLWLG